MRLFDEQRRLIRLAGFREAHRPVLVRRSVATHSEDESSADAVTIGEDVTCTLTGTDPLEDYTSADAVGITEAVTAELQLAGRAVEHIRVLGSVLAYLPAIEDDTANEGVGVTEAVTTQLDTPVEEVSESDGVTVAENVNAELDRDFWRTITEGMTIAESVLVYGNLSLLTRNPQFVEAALNYGELMPRFWQASTGGIAGSTLSYYPDSGIAGTCYVQTFGSVSIGADDWYQSQTVSQAPFLADNTDYTLTLVSKCTEVSGTPYTTVTVRDQEGYYLTSAGGWSTTPQAAITRSPLLADASPVTTTLDFTSRATIANAGRGLITWTVGGLGPGWQITGKAYRIEITNR